VNQCLGKDGGSIAMLIWCAVLNLHNPELQWLAKDLTKAVMCSKATSLTKKYLGAFKRWRVCAASHQIMTFPLMAVHLAPHLRHLGEAKASKSAVGETVNRAYSMAGIPLRTATPLVQSTLGGL